MHVKALMICLVVVGMTVSTSIISTTSFIMKEDTFSSGYTGYGYESYSSTGTASDAYDYGAMTWINAHEAFQHDWSYDVYGALDDVGIAVIDDGISKEVLGELDERGVTFRSYIRVDLSTSKCLRNGVGYTIEYDDQLCDDYSFKYIVDEATGPKVDYDGDGTDDHGPKVIPIIPQVAQEVDIWLFDENENHNDHLGHKLLRIAAAYKWMINNRGSHNIKVISMSIGLPDTAPPKDDNAAVDESKLQDEIDYLKTTIGQARSKFSIFNSAGNTGTYESNTIRDLMIGVTSHNDVDSGTETCKKKHQRSCSSSYGSHVMFTMPVGSDGVESMEADGDFIKFSGTSAAAPMAAAAAAVLYAVGKAAGVLFYPSDIFGFLRDTAEQGAIANYMPEPTIGSRTFYGRNDYVGYGVIDLYDAITAAIAYADFLNLPPPDDGGGSCGKLCWVM